MILRYWNKVRKVEKTLIARYPFTLFLSQTHLPRFREQGANKPLHLQFVSGRTLQQSLLITISNMTMLISKPCTSGSWAEEQTLQQSFLIIISQHDNVDQQTLLHLQFVSGRTNPPTKPSYYNRLQHDDVDQQTLLHLRFVSWRTKPPTKPSDNDLQYEDVDQQTQHVGFLSGRTLQQSLLIISNMMLHLTYSRTDCSFCS
jgi:hypothetical protein